MLHKCIGTMTYKDKYWEMFSCSASKKESKEKVSEMLMPEIIGYKVREQVRCTNKGISTYRVTLSIAHVGSVKCFPESC